MLATRNVLPKIVAKTMAGSSLLETAIALAKAGVVIFPCTKTKKPKIYEWQHLSTPDETQVRQWFDPCSETMLGLPAGANGLFVIDLDKAKKPGGCDGLQEFQVLCGKHHYDFMAATLCAKTGSGGLHVFFQMPSSHKLRNSTKRLGKAIDTRGYGGYVIIAPSRGERGQYEWLNQNPIAELPDWLLALLKKTELQPERKPFKKLSGSGGMYVNERERKAYQRALMDECKNVATAPEGMRNETLNRASYNLGRYVGANKLDDAEVYEALYEAARECGLPPGEIGKTINSGFSSGKRNPKIIEPHGGSWELKENVGSSKAKEHNKPAQEKSLQARLDEYLARTNARQLIDGFLDAREEFARSSAIKTGFPKLDALLDGGLYPGLYVLGAISSLGKTTFALQMADAMAQAGHDVLIFSLEMSKHELIAKSMSRISKLEATRQNLPEERAKTARHYLCGKWCSNNTSSEEVTNVYQILEIYAQWATHIYIVEGSYSLNVLGIVDAVKKHIQITGNIPIVIVDYLQILAPLSERYTDKQNIDRSIVELKRLSRDLKLPVLVISSFNRDSYTTKATMNAFKESGAIEYTADVLMGLQFRGMKEKFDVDAAKKSNPREIELVIIKNRHGQCGEAQFKYYPKFNLFQD